MASQENVKKLNGIIKECLELFEKDLISRSQWGNIHFTAAQANYEQAKFILTAFKDFPNENLPDDELQKIQGAIDNLKQYLKQIDEFDIAKAENPGQQRDKLLGNIKGAVDSLVKASAPWLPFLAYLKGDVAENISKLNEAVRESSQILDDSRKSVEKSGEEIGEIIAKAREASAAAGAAVFTEDFRKESESQESFAKYWFWGAIASFVATITWTVWQLYFSDVLPDELNARFFQIIIAKLVVLSMLIFATVFCISQFRTIKHLATGNNHRALSLKTLQAFASAASDDQTKNAVLIEACRAVFQPGSTGYLLGQEDGSPPSHQFIEVIKGINKGQ